MSEDAITGRASGAAAAGREFRLECAASMVEAPTSTSARSSALPLRLIERVGPVEGRETASFEVMIAADSLFFRGHFPGRPIFPGIAQIAAIVLPGIHELWPALVQPRRLSRLKFRAPISPDEGLRLSLERSASESVRFRLTRAGTLCSEGVLEFPGSVSL